jgi:hypothetical protein
MGSGNSKQEEKNDGERKKATASNLADATVDKNDIFNAADTNNPSHDLTDYITIKNNYEKTTQYSRDINAFITAINDAVLKGGTDENAVYKPINVSLQPYKTAADTAAAALTYDNTVGAFESSAYALQGLKKPAENALKTIDDANTNLINITKNNNTPTEDKQKQAIIARTNAEFLDQLYHTGSNILDIRGAEEYKTSAEAAKTLAATQYNIASTNKELAQSKYGEYTTFYDHYHNEPWLTSEIARYRGIYNNASTAKNVSHIPIKTADELSKSLKQGELVTAFQSLSANKQKGSAYDQTQDELTKLLGELTECNKVLDAKRKIGSNYDISMGEISISTLNLALEKAKNDEIDISGVLDEQKITITDLSAAILDISGQIFKILGSISEKELNVINLNKSIDDLNLTIDNLVEKIYSNKVFNNQNILKLSQDIDQKLQHIFSDLKTQNINPNLLYEKIKYRDIESQKLRNANKVLDILFYCFYFSFIVIGLVTRNVKIEDFLIYVFVGVIPFLYPFMYKNTSYIIGLFHVDGNKNAFIEDETPIDAYNI